LRKSALEVFRKTAKSARRTLKTRLLAWRAIAKRLLNPRVIYVGVTGSCGKTTTTQLLGAVLSSAGECTIHVERNTVRALAKSVLSNGPSTKYAVHEVSGSCPGRVRQQTWFLRPQIGVITTIGGDHYKMYRNLEATAREKGKLAEALPKHGTLILNADDPNVRALAHRTRAHVITYGLSNNADFRGIEVSSEWPDRLALTVAHGNESIRIASKLVGEFWATSILAAVACGVCCGLDLRTCADAISRFEPAFGRCSVHQTPSGAAYIFDHKAPMWTIANSLAFLARARAPRKTIIFGTISDYPGSASQRYRRIAREALQVANRVVFVGPHSGHVGKLREGELRKRLFEFQTTYEAAEFMRPPALPGELILLKGSITTDHLERIMLSQFETVVCWKQGCGVMHGCPLCKHYRKPSPLPFGLERKIDAEIQSGI
jgi:UDP-N-acetylmuramoyl-tripeptide--D-alanyl-D-alanine ligase